MRWVAEIPARLRIDDVGWLAIEFDSDSSGWFLFECTTPSCVKWDSWHLTRQEALAQAKVRWGTQLKDWQPPIEGEVLD